MNCKTILLILLTTPMLMLAQEKLNDLKAPTSPASSILGLQPAAILTPKSYQALETTLYSNFINTNGNTVIPNDFALEFTPYWTKNHHLSLDEYLYPIDKFEQFRRNSSFSLASTQNFLLEDSTVTNGLGFGYRTTFYFGNNKDRLEIEDFKDDLRTTQLITSKIVSQADNIIEQEDIKSNKDFLEKIKDIVIKAIFELSSPKNMNSAIEITDKIYQEAAFLEPFDTANVDTFLNSFYDLIDKHLDASKLFNTFKNYIKERQGFLLDVAYANFLNFPTNNFEYSVVPRQSFWVTPTYRWQNKNSYFKISGVLRYEWYNTDYYKKYFTQAITFQKNIDCGIAISTELQKFSLQFEIISRSSNSEVPAGTDANGNELYTKFHSSDLQYLGTFSYNITGQIVISYVLGNRFEPIQNPNSTLVSLFSLNLGFGSPSLNDLDLEK